MKKKKPLIDGLPAEFVHRLKEQFPKDADSILKTFQQRLPVIRTNQLIISPKKLKENLKGKGIELKSISLLKDSFIADTDRRTLTDLDEYKQGLFYIQSIASQLAVKALDPKAGERILDLCAAPGSKTTQIGILMKKSGELIANDNNRKRIYRLWSNLENQQLDDFVKVKNYSGQNYPKFYPDYFDRVLVDAPCSSEARFDTRYPKSIKFWSKHKVKAFAKLAKRLLSSAIQCTKSGGVIVYSTCTFSQRENELVLDAILKKHPEVKVDQIKWRIKKLPILKSWKGKKLNKEINKEISHAVRIYPNEQQEGFFISKLRKARK